MALHFTTNLFFFFTVHVKPTPLTYTLLSVSIESSLITFIDDKSTFSLEMEHEENSIREII
mgnify:CR=1 FL=1